MSALQLVLRFGYDAVFTEADLLRLEQHRAYAGTKPLALDDKGKLTGYESFIMDLETALSFRTQFTVERAIGGTQALEDFRPRNEATPLNNKVKVIVPGLGLLDITTVEVMTDACTDLLNERLAAGWRILAICPQPDQRRPDYILGKPGGDQ